MLKQIQESYILESHTYNEEEDDVFRPNAYEIIVISGSVFLILIIFALLLRNFLSV